MAKAKKTKKEEVVKLEPIGEIKLEQKNMNLESSQFYLMKTNIYLLAPYTMDIVKI